MDSEADDYVDVTHWVQDVARRGVQITDQSRTELSQRSSESSEDVLRYLERLTGRELRSREAVNSYFEELAADQAEKTRAATRRRIIREGLLLGVLLAAYLHYYYWDVSLQMASLEQIRFFVPANEDRSSREGIFRAS